MGAKVALNDRCCGESGTLAVTRPDISTQVRFRKEEEMRKGAGQLRADGFTGDVKVLTSCPSCLQGLSRFDDDAGTQADYIVVEIAKPRARRELDGRLRGEGQRGRHRARARLGRTTQDEALLRGRATVGSCGRAAVIPARSRSAAAAASRGSRRVATAAATSGSGP